MKHALRMESIGYDARWRKRQVVKGGSPKAWVAQLLRLASGDIGRVYLKPYVGYRGANSVGSRGVMFTFLIEEMRIYEVEHPLSWKTSRHYFVTHDGQDLLELTASEAHAYV